MRRCTSRRHALGVTLLALVALNGCDAGGVSEPAGGPDPAERAAQRAAEIAARYGVEAVPPQGLDIETPFSTVRVHDVGLQRSLFFVRDDGALVLQSRINLALPHRLMVPYSRAMFASYLFQPEPSRVLIVGLGGGAMVRFLERHDPDLGVDAVDIDPQMVEIAQRHFGVRPTDRVRLLVADGYEVVRGAAEVMADDASGTVPSYDVIYMDAFLRPSEETDGSGNPLRLKGSPFYGAMRQRLGPGGVAVFNLYPQPERERDVDELRAAFPQLYLFHDDEDLNWVAVATVEAERLSEQELRARAAELDLRFTGDLSVSHLLALLQPDAASGSSS